MAIRWNDLFGIYDFYYFSRADSFYFPNIKFRSQGHFWQGVAGDQKAKLNIQNGSRLHNRPVLEKNLR